MSEVFAKVQLGFVTLVTVAFLVVTMPSTAHADLPVQNATRA